ncbi:MAG: hypothetical protein FWF15_12080, partial [Oscillospiraceae bacterium]|nr:hypothetical protein [Oscillospiraceae bacterium]
MEIVYFNDTKNEFGCLASFIFEWLEEKGYKNADVLILNLNFAQSIEDEGYVYFPTENGASINASCLSGLWAGAGHFLFNSQIKDGELLPSKEYFKSIPQKKIRGIYFASHFHNFYHDAPIIEIKRYVKELALWGINALCVWFDMHHYNGINDPDAVEMVSRLRAILEAAQVCGMKASIGVLSNEGFATTPYHLKADWRAGQNGYLREPVGHYHVEICPNVSGGMELILKNREDMCRAFEGIDFEYIWIWPYDQGGCTCEKCTPWGANGFLKVAPTVAEMCRKCFPKSKMILSLWDFDAFIEGETETFKKAFKNENNYVDYILCEVQAGANEICGLPIVGFPEISMRGAVPWGGFGANPLPTYVRQIWDISKNEKQGGFPYSEGIYEDLNKFLMSRMYWNGDYDVRTGLIEYASAYFSRNCAETIADCLFEMETTLPRYMQHSGEAIYPYGFKESEYVKDGTKFIIYNPEKINSIYTRMMECDAVLPPEARSSWRWRILYLRAVIDKELAANDYTDTETIRNAYKELTKIYHANGA